MDTHRTRAHSALREPAPSAEEALRRLQQQVGESPAYFTHFVNAKVDRFKLSARQYVVWAARGVVSLIALVGLAVHVIALVLVGAAARFTLLFNGRLWLGQKVVGRGVVGLRIWQRKLCQQKVQQYDAHQVQQRAAFGHSVANRTTEDAAVPQALGHSRRHTGTTGPGRRQHPECAVCASGVTSGLSSRGVGTSHRPTRSHRPGRYRVQAKCHGPDWR
jgi:hypothetical protein